MNIECKKVGFQKDELNDWKNWGLPSIMVVDENFDKVYFYHYDSWFLFFTKVRVGIDFMSLNLWHITGQSSVQFKCTFISILQIMIQTISCTIIM